MQKNTPAPSKSVQPLVRVALACSGAIVLWGASLALAQTPLGGPSGWVWKDSRGVKNYSDTPPPLGVPETAILQRPGQRSTATAVVSAAASAPKPAASKATGKDSELEKRKKDQAAAAEKVKADEDAAAKAKEAARDTADCQRARRNLAGLQSGGRVARLNDKGEREFISDDNRAAEAATASSEASEACR